jgi:RNA polymerase sigma-70 factor, ECF subfamily
MNGELEALMTRYQAGDFDAARSLIDRISPALHRLLDTRAANRADADDLLQETWLRIHRVRHTYRPGKPVLPWIFAIARRVRVDHYRKSVRTSSREQRWEEVAESVPTPGTEAHRADELRELLAVLSESQREVLEMMKVAGMSLEEVARATSCSVGSVKQKVHRAYAKLRKTMNLIELRKGQTGVVP